MRVHGFAGHQADWDLVMGCDATFMVGSGFPYLEFLSKECDAWGLQINIGGRMLSLRYPMEINLGGSAATCVRCCHCLERKTY
jgi:pyruvate dehydrogenase (quinone)